LTDLDLTPRDPRHPAASGLRSWRNWLIALTLVGVAGVVLYQALTSARVYFLNVDEAVERRGELGEDTFNLQGTVTAEPRTEADGTMIFTVSFGGVDATVRHIGDEPSGLFRQGERVVAKGRWSGAPSTEGDTPFVSDQVLVKHSEEYVEDNPDRVDYELDGNEIEIGAGIPVAVGEVAATPSLVT
jgi:cytochrome c-type biogenesis protein CcmE